MEKTSSALPAQHSALTQVTWESITDPGAYVEIGTGDLYRIPKEALQSGASPVIRKQSLGASRLLKVSENPFITTMEARMLAAEHNAPVNF